MPSRLACQLRARLEDSEVLIEPERRGRDPHPGRPDSVLWLRPSGLPVGRLAPLLVELEGAKQSQASYHCGKEDMRAFASRHDPSDRPRNDEFQYHIKTPVLDWTIIETMNDGVPYIQPDQRAAPLTVPVEYDVFPIPSSTITGKRSATDSELHSGLCNLFQEAIANRQTPTGFTTEAEIMDTDAAEVVWWRVHWKLPHANDGTVSVPFVVDAEPKAFKLFMKHKATPLSVPMMIVIDGSPSARNGSETRETGMRLPYLNPASIQRSSAPKTTSQTS